MKAKDLKGKSMRELTAIYNGQTGKAVKGFSSKMTAVARIMDTAPKNGKRDVRLTSLEATSSRSVRQIAEEKLLQVEPTMMYEEIIVAVKEELPHASTSVACLRWYATQMRERGERVPDRPRKPHGVTILN